MGRPKKAGSVKPQCKAINCNVESITKGFCNAHYQRLLKTGDANSPRRKGIKGQGGLSSQGYRLISHDLEHRVIAAKILGRPLKTEEQIHHWNEIKTDNRLVNLVICPNNSYHMLLHKRTRAYDACGHADWVWCHVCQQFDDPNKLVRSTHPKCLARYRRERRKEKREAI